MTETGSEVKETDSEMTETGPEKKETGPEMTETGSEVTETDSEMTETDSEKKETDSEMTETGPEKKETGPEMTETDSEMTETGPEKKETGSEKKETDSEEKETSSENLSWFIVHTLSGSEKKVKRLLAEEIESSSLSDKFGQILIPTENVSRIRGGKRQIVERQLYPGYILIEMEMEEETLRLVSTTPGVMGFLGTKLKPQALKDGEVKRVLTAVETERGTVSSEIPFKRGEAVKVAGGPFTDFTGVVEDLYPSRGRLKVMVTIFGRATPVELDFTQVKPI